MLATQDQSSLCITDVDLSDVKTARADVERLEALLKARKAWLQQREDEIVATLRDPSCRYLGDPATTPRVVIETRRLVSWKTAFADLATRAGMDAVALIDEVQVKTPLSVSYRLRLAGER